MVRERGLGVVCRHPSKVKKVSMQEGSLSWGSKPMRVGASTYGVAPCVCQSLSTMTKASSCDGIRA